MRTFPFGNVLCVQIEIKKGLQKGKDYVFLYNLGISGWRTDTCK